MGRPASSMSETFHRKMAKMSNKRTRILLLLSLIGALIAATILCNARANAAPDITPYSKDWADNGAAIVLCSTFDKHGMTEDTVTMTVQVIEEVASVSQYEAAGILVYSVHDYCPRYWTKLGQIAGATPEQIEQRRFAV